MTMPDPDDDARLDARLRQAAGVPFDDIGTTEAVLSQVRGLRRRAPVRRAGWWGWAAPVAFASVLLATPFVVAFYPAGDDAFLIGLATGDARAILAEAGLGRAGALGEFVE